MVKLRNKRACNAAKQADQDALEEEERSEKSCTPSRYLIYIYIYTDIASRVSTRSRAEQMFAPCCRGQIAAVEEKDR